MDTNGADGLGLLGDPTRRAIFELLARHPCTVGELAQQLPITRSAVSQHLRVLTEAGLVRVAYAREDFDAVLAVVAEKVSPRILRAPARLDEAARQLGEYFDGTRRTFDLPLDHALSAGFRRTVQLALPDIAYGHTASYGDVARAVGNPAAVRAVGSACATNPLPVVVPCHRVLRSDGSLGGYVGGAAAKTALLDLERAA